jgi:hypothetical protein
MRASPYRDAEDPIRFVFITGHRAAPRFVASWSKDDVTPPSPQELTKVELRRAAPDGHPAQGTGVAVTIAVGVAVTIAVGVAVTVTVGVGVAVTVGVGVAVTVGVGVAVTVGVGVGVTVAIGVTVVVGVGVADAVAGADGAPVEVGDMLGVGVLRAWVAGEVTRPEFAPVIWGVQAVTPRAPAASNAMTSGRPSRRSDRPRPRGLGSCHMTIPSLPE